MESMSKSERMSHSGTAISMRIDFSPKVASLGLNVDLPRPGDLPGQVLPDWFACSAWTDLKLMDHKATSPQSAGGCAVKSRAIQREDNRKQE